jgi:hypothetical protein
MIGLIFAALMAFVWATAGIYSFPYMAHEGGEKRYYALYLATLGALMGLCFSGSIIPGPADLLASVVFRYIDNISMSSRNDK